MLRHCPSPFLPEQLNPNKVLSGFHTNLDAGEALAVVEVVDVVEATVWGADCCWSGWVVDSALGRVGTADGGEEEEDHGLGRGEVFSVPCWGFEFGFDPGPVPKNYTRNRLASLKRKYTSSWLIQKVLYFVWYVVCWCGHLKNKDYVMYM